MILNLHDAKGGVGAIVIREHTAAPGLTFFGAKEHPLQLGCMKHPTGKEIRPHTHNWIERKTYGTAEVIFVKSGRVLLNFYSDPARHPSMITSQCEMKAGDVVILLGGGHGFQVLEEAELWEVKSGPYLGELDKTLIG